MYLKWNSKTITDFDEKNTESLYNLGFVFTREKKGAMSQTRSVRVDLNKFELSSENKRILRKNEGVELKQHALPYSDYHWTIGKTAKDFYEQKFGKNIFSANKIKELLTEQEKSNFNLLLEFCHSEAKDDLSLRAQRSNLSSPTKIASSAIPPRNDTATIGYAICFQTKNILHYSYPFYNLSATNDLPNIGIGMMTKAMILAKASDKDHIYLGSAKDTASLYKFQFKGVEWFDGKNWSENIEDLKNTF